MLRVMKRTISISLALLLLVSITGVTVNTHYCHGQARYTVIATDADHSSCCGGEMDACPSCEDRVQTHVMDEQGAMPALADQQVEMPVLALVPAVDETCDDLRPVRPLHPMLHGPPGASAGMAIPILVQSFLN